MEQRTITITLEVEVEGDDVRGHASSAADGSDRPFAGWLGLIGAIDALLGDSLPDPASTEADADSVHGSGR